MIKIWDLEVHNIHGAIIGMRNPLESWSKSDSHQDGSLTWIGDKDLELMQKLCKAGSDHRKFMRQILVSGQITAPEYWWKEFDTYKVGTVANSTSTMHRVMAKAFSESMFSWEDVPQARQETMLNQLNYLRQLYLIKMESEKADEAKQIWRELIQTLPMSWNYTRGVTLNYEVLLNQYRSRKNHKLGEWQDYLKIMTDLPYFMAIVGE
jgi:hypothetical protein